MKNLKLRSGLYSRVLCFVLFAQIILFSQCKKEQEVKPDPIAQEGSSEIPENGSADTTSSTDEGNTPIVPEDPETPIDMDGPVTTNPTPVNPTPVPVTPTPTTPSKPTTPVTTTPTTPATPAKPTTPVTTTPTTPAKPTTPVTTTPTTPAKPTTPVTTTPTTPVKPTTPVTTPTTPVKPTTPTSPVKPAPTTPTTPTAPKPTTPTPPVTSVPPVSTPANPTVPTVAAYTVKNNEQVIDGSKIKIVPGGVLKIQGGARGPLLLKNFAGTAGQPILIVNDGNVVINASSSNSYGFKLENCKYFRLTGSNGGSGYGITVNGGHIGMSYDKLSTEFTVDHIEVKNCGFAGMMAKTDPTCDASTQRGNFTMSNLKFFNNYVHDVKGEGFYIGNSFYASGKSLSCGNVLPHAITNVEVFNNKISNTGCEGIQAGCVVSGLKIYNNTVDNFGTSPFANAQDNGVQIGEGSSGLMYNNVIRKGPGNGIIVLGSGNTKIFNNVVVDAGSFGAFIDNRGPASGDILFANNTFVKPGKGGIKTFNELVNNKFYNNIFAGTSSYVMYGSGAKGEESNNLMKASVDECGFVNPAAGNYQLKEGSEAKDKGANTAGYGITFDYANKKRPSGSAHDIGAFEL